MKDKTTDAVAWFLSQVVMWFLVMNTVVVAVGLSWFVARFFYRALLQ